jgi:hypothetical protein
MNIIALSLGLVPVPPLPPESHRRQHLADLPRVRSASGRIGPGFNAEVVAMLRNTGPATAFEVADFFGQDLDAIKLRLTRLQEAGEIRCCGRRRSSTAELWEARDA